MILKYFLLSILIIGISFAEDCVDAVLVVEPYVEMNLASPHKNCLLQFYALNGKALKMTTSNIKSAKDYLIVDYQFGSIRFGDGKHTHADTTMETVFPPGPLNITIMPFDDIIFSKNIQFTLAVVEVHQNGNPCIYENTSLTQPLIIQEGRYPTGSCDTIVIRSDSKVILTTLSLPDIEWTSVWIYEGEPPNNRIVGTAYSYLNNLKYSESNIITIYFADDFYIPRKSYFIVTFPNMVDTIGEIAYSWSKSSSNSYNQQFHINASHLPSALTMGSKDFINENQESLYLMNIEFTDSNASLIVYAGAAMNSFQQYIITTYNVSIVSNSLPQLFSGIQTFQLDKGMATVTFESDHEGDGNLCVEGISKRNWMNPRKGRNGFLMTNSFKLIDSTQTISTTNTINETGDYFDFKLDYHAEMENALEEFNMKAFTESGLQSFSGKSTELKDFKIRAKGFDIAINGKNTNTTGGILRFQINSAFTIGFNCGFSISTKSDFSSMIYLFKKSFCVEKSTSKKKENLNN